MLKFFGRGNIVRDSENFDGTTKYNNLEFYNNNDTKSGHDIERPIDNIYQNQYEIINFLEEFANQEISNDGVFPNSLTNEFQITAADIVQVTIDAVDTNFIRIPPGIAAIKHADVNVDNRSNGIIVINEPSLKIAERQIAKILGLNLPYGVESIDIKYNSLNDSYKAKIKKKLTLITPPVEYFFGVADQANFDDDTVGVVGFETGAELLADIYNHVDLKDYFVNALAGDITKIVLEPFFQVSSVNLYYFIVDKADGEIKMITTAPSGSQFQLASVNVTGVADGGGFTQDNIDNTHLLVNSTKLITTTDTGVDSFKVDSSGGIKLETATGVIVDGDFTVTGTQTSVNSTDLDVTDNVISINVGETGPGVTATSGNAGIVVKRGDGVSAGEEDYNIIFDEADDAFKIGADGNEQPVATREEAPIDGAGVVWNATTNRFESSSGFSTPTPVSEFEYDTQTDFDWSVRDTGTAPASGFSISDMINDNRQDLYEYIELLSTEGASYLVAAGASLIGCNGIDGVTPTAKSVNDSGNLQQMLEGIFALITTKTAATSFPTDPAPKLGDECYRTDLDEWYKFNSVTWVQI